MPARARYKLLRARVGYGLVLTLIALLRLLPDVFCRALAAGMAFILGHVVGVRRRVVLDNLKHAFPAIPHTQRQEIYRRMWRHWAFVMVETILARRLTGRNWRKHVTAHGLEQLQGILAAGRPVVLLTGHYGGFQLNLRLIGLLGHTLHAVVRPLRNPYLDRYITAFHQATGSVVIPSRGGYRQMHQALAGGGILGLLPDQYGGSKGCWVHFLGRPTSFPRSIAVLALRHKAIVVVGYTHRLGWPLKYEWRLAGVADPLRRDEACAGRLELTQWYASALERIIREDPSQYWWMHRLWKTRAVTPTGSH